MKEKEAIELIEETKGISPLTRNFVFWLYGNGYLILDPDEMEEYKDRKREDSLNEII